jgi:predicted dehydrogenase
LLGRDDIDAVVISTPDHTHAVITLAAIKRGKHVYCEKPLTHSIYESRTVREAAKQAGVATQMGNQGHSDEGIRLMREWIEDGAIGAVRRVYVWTNRPSSWWVQGIERPKETPPVPENLDWELWLGPAPYRPYHPAYVPFKWRGWWDFGSGALGDMGCHLIDIPYWSLKLGSPVSIKASCTAVNSETAPVASIIHYEFPKRGKMPAVRMSWYDGGLMPERPKELEEGRQMGDKDGGVLLVGDKGTIMCGCYGSGPRIIPESKMCAYKRPDRRLLRSKGHYQDWVEACKGGSPASSNFEYGGALTEVVLLGTVAIRENTVGKRLDWDGERMQVTNVPETDMYIKRQYREGWSL